MRLEGDHNRVEQHCEAAQAYNCAKKLTDFFRQSVFSITQPPMTNT